MVASMLKLLALLFFILIYLYLYEVNPASFMACFFYLYFFNTLFEVYALIRNLRLQNQK